MAIDFNDGRTDIVGNGYNISFGYTEAGTPNFTLNSDEGYTFQITSSGSSRFNPGKGQSFTLSDNFNTVLGNNSEYVKKVKEIRVEGDYVVFAGPTQMLMHQLQEQWYLEYQKGWGTFKEQYQDNRNLIPLTFYPVNSAFSAPKYSNIKTCPPLVDGTYADNLTAESKAAFESQFSDNSPAALLATEKTQNKLNAIYSNKLLTMTSVYNSLKYKA